MNNEFSKKLDLWFLIQAINEIVPSGTEEKLDADGCLISLANRDEDIKITVTPKKREFNDSEVKEYVSEFKSNIEALDDSLFVKITEEFGKTFDTKQFDALLKQESYTEQEAKKVVSMISEFTYIECKYLLNEIEKLVELHERF